MPDGPTKVLYESWIAQSAVPTAPVTVKVHLHDCTKYGVAACTDANSRPMIMVFPDLGYLFDPGFQDTRLAADQLETHLNFMHELGHVRDYSFRRHAYRRKFMRILRLSSGLHGVKPSWDAAYNRGGQLIYPYEQWAMAFADCSVFSDALPWQVAHVVYPGYDFYPTAGEYTKLCSLIRSL